MLFGPTSPGQMRGIFLTRIQTLGKIPQIELTFAHSEHALWGRFRRSLFRKAIGAVVALITAVVRVAVQ